ncbi:short-chain dehydrogenase/reductase [Penicillium chermesinum]|uniref:Short-chain dehydrogenase/reductase n=1 Tax=Penicillium chermesinum TaxID=63820 RepID=A0A9W9PKF9_9EURO|nr:short-chain dehydrogenase/reductase [Penicillium chermesinum]KAJ5249072.1 short-chain dehydrogenase/reductase [Penicillium chermesinum]KAJ6151178.1 short-chain dehydrogenase/reductase [Penicillium chermesinum]
MNNGFALVTPASRGLGFAFTQTLLTKTTLPVIATARKNTSELRDRLLSSDVPNGAKERLRVLEVDVTDENTISSMAETIREDYPDTHLRVALAVPGILHVEKSPSQVDAGAALDSFKVNSLGPLLLMKHLSPFLPTKAITGFPEADDQELKLPSHAIYAIMAARVGSISDNSSGGWYSYRASKAAVYQLTKTFDLYLRGRCAERALAVALHPGTVRTDFTKEFWKGRDMLEPNDSAERLLQFLVNMKPGLGDGRGRCWDWKGEEVLP